MICFSLVTTDTGLRLPAKEICALARQRGILTLWDGCQAVGQFPLDLDDMGCDFYAANCYKWLLGPMGTGFLFVSKENLKLLKPLLHPHDPDAGAAQYKTSNQANVLYLGVGATIDYINSIGGLAAIQAEVTRKADVLKAKLSEIPGVVICSSRRPETQTGAVCYGIENLAGGDLDKALKTRWEIAQRGTSMSQPTGVRISVSFYTSDEELDTLVDATQVLAGEAGHG